MKNTKGKEHKAKKAKGKKLEKNTFTIEVRNRFKATPNLTFVF